MDQKPNTVLQVILTFGVIVGTLFTVAALAIGVGLTQGQTVNDVEFLWKRLADDCPLWAIIIPVLFALFVVGLIVLFRPEGKLLTALVGGAIVGAISFVYLPMAFIFKPFFSWMVILLPVMLVALFYVGMMYLKDARSVHPLWAIFLGLLRCCVYLILAVVFLLPGCQHSEKQEYESKIIVLFDVSGSMLTKDGTPVEGQKIEDMPTRQDKIFTFLTASFDDNGREQTPFIQRLLAKSPVTAGRFGAVLDETDVLHLNNKTNKTYTVEQWRKWLNPDPKDLTKPNVEEVKDDKERQDKLAAYNARLDMIELLRSGTNVGGSALAMHKLENNSYLQAIIIISDGQSNLGSDEDRTNFLTRVNAQKRLIPVITVGVGEYRQPASIRIDDLQVAEETRPEDMFPVRVPVVGQGLHGEPFTVKIEVTRVKNLEGLPVQEKTHVFPDKVGVFKGQGDNPQDLIQFEVDVGTLKGIVAKDDKNGDLEGVWEIVARVPKNAKEVFDKPEHVTKPVAVRVQKRALRVLLFASGATREFQFVRTLVYREVLEKRMEMSVLVQSGKEDHVDHNVEPDRMLVEFPGRLGLNEPGKQHQSLNDYDVIVAFDVDWSRLGPKDLNALREWVSTHAGGVIFASGPVFSYQLARAGGRDISSLLAIFPVVLQDNRLHGLSFSGSGLGHDSSKPYPLTFAPNAKDFDFLKLDEAHDTDSPTAGWNGFFWNVEKNPTKDKQPRRGFYSYYPVERLKPDSMVAATFAGPKESRIGDKTDAYKDQQPFIVTMRHGQGKSLYLGSGEFWRLRGYKDGYHERFWIKSMRHVAAAGVQQKKYGRLLMPRSMPVGEVRVEAQIKGKDYLPLPRDIIPHIIVKKIDKDQDDAPKDPKGKEKPKEKEAKPNKQLTFELKPKESDGDWEGYFTGSFRGITEPGEYEFQLPIPNTTEMLKQNLTVRKLRPELDNVRTNFDYLYQMASEADTIFKKLPADVKKEIEPLLQMPQDRAGVGGATKRLFFPVASADAISKCILPIAPKTDTVKGRFEYLWDKGEQDVFWVVLFIPLLVGAIGALILLIVGQPLGAWMFFGICTLMTVLMGAAYGIISMLGITLPVEFSYVMMLVVGLLGIEWLARKLLRLA